MWTPLWTLQLHARTNVAHYGSVIYHVFLVVQHSWTLSARHRIFFFYLLKYHGISKIPGTSIPVASCCNEQIQQVIPVLKDRTQWTNCSRESCWLWRVGKLDSKTIHPKYASSLGLEQHLPFSIHRRVLKDLGQALVNLRSFVLFVCKLLLTRLWAFLLHASGNVRKNKGGVLLAHLLRDLTVQPELRLHVLVVLHKLLGRASINFRSCVNDLFVCELPLCNSNSFMGFVVT